MESEDCSRALSLMDMKMALLTKKSILLLFCCFRQAERSVDYALSSPSAWKRFVAYYDKSMSVRVSGALSLLKEAGAGSQTIVDCPEASIDIRGNAVSCAMAFFCNLLKRHWWFSDQEIAYFSAALERLRQATSDAVIPDSDKLIKLRFNFYNCCYIIERKLIGVRFLRKANNIEHFEQSDYVRHYEFRELDSDSENHVAVQKR